MAATATATDSNMTGSETPAVNAEQYAEQKIEHPVDSDSGKEILDRINKAVVEHSLDNLKKNLNMTQISEMMPTMFTIMKDMLAKLNTQTQMLTALLNNKNVENTNLKNEISALKKEVIDLQHDKVKTQVRISKLPLHNRAIRGRETAIQSYEVVADLIKEMDMPNPPEAFDCVRIPSKIPTHLPTMLVKFYFAADHANFFRNLPSLKGKAKYSVFVNQNFPQGLTERLKVLTDQAKQIRAATGDLTSIRYKNANLHLHTKPKIGGEWTQTAI